MDVLHFARAQRLIVHANFARALRYHIHRIRAPITLLHNLSVRFPKVHNCVETELFDDIVKLLADGGHLIDQIEQSASWLFVLRFLVSTGVVIVFEPLFVEIGAHVPCQRTLSVDFLENLATYELFHT